MERIQSIPQVSEVMPYMSDEPMLKVERLTKTYATAAGPLTVLRDVTLDVAAGETLAVVGPSGSGKTTLLGLCAGLDAPTTGAVTLNGADLGRLTEDGRALLRNACVGFVFQNFQLIPTLTALENVLVPLELRTEAPGGRGTTWPRRAPCWNEWASVTGWDTIRCSFPGVNSSACRWRAPSSTGRRSCFATSRRATSTTRRRRR